MQALAKQGSRCKLELSNTIHMKEYKTNETDSPKLSAAAISFQSIEHAMRASPFGHVLLFKMADEVLEADIACLDHYDYFFRPDLLSGKVAFITGGGSGIGFTITEVFMRYVT